MKQYTTISFALKKVLKNTSPKTIFNSKYLLGNAAAVQTVGAGPCLAKAPQSNAGHFFVFRSGVQLGRPGPSRPDI